MENFPDLPTILAVASAAIVTTLILNRWLFKPLNRILSQRLQRTNEALEKFQEAQDTQAQRLTEIEANLAEARREAYELREAGQRAGRERREELMKEARDAAQEMLGAARADIAADVKAARSDLETEADRLSEMIAERLLGRSLTSKGKSDP
jgi:F-type H+-transporting ATPase subunit b